MARTLAPGSPTLADHPKNVYLAERAVLPALNRWIGGLFDRRHREETVATLLACQDGGGDTNARQAMKKRLSDAETRLRRLKDAIEAGVDPGALVESINEAQAQRAAARAELSAAGPGSSLLSDAEIYAMIDSFSDVGEALNRANPPGIRKLYEELRLEMIYDPEAKAVDVAVRPLGGVVRVSEGGVVHYTVEPRPHVLIKG